MQRKAWEFQYDRAGPKWAFMSEAGGSGEVGDQCSSLAGLFRSIDLYKGALLSRHRGGTPISGSREALLKKPSRLHDRELLDY